MSEISRGQPAPITTQEFFFEQWKEALQDLDELLANVMEQEACTYQERI